jgi:hypothetical protein
VTGRPARRATMSGVDSGEQEGQKWGNPLQDGEDPEDEGDEPTTDPEDPVPMRAESPKNKVAKKDTPNKKTTQERKLQTKSKEKGIAPESAFSVGLPRQSV